jgi:hypothetical protein
MADESFDGGDFHFCSMAFPGCEVWEWVGVLN